MRSARGSLNYSSSKALLPFITSGLLTMAFSRTVPLLALLTLILGCSHSAERAPLEVQLASYRDFVLTSDYRGQASTLPPEMVESAGGRRQMAKLLREGGSVMAHTSGVGQEVQSWTWGAPQSPLEYSQAEFIIVPFTVEVSLPDGGMIRTNRSMVAFSRGPASRWELVQANTYGGEWLEERFRGLLSRLALPPARMTVRDALRGTESNFMEVDGVWVAAP